jgi:hypothetical protein
LIEKIGLQACSKLIFNVEYFPYHSEKYKPIKKILPSQEYSFSLVREAMNNKKIIIIMRSEKLWHEAIPELKNYSYKYLLHSFLNVVVSPNNLGKSEFEVVINRLTEAASQKP